MNDAQTDGKMSYMKGIIVAPKEGTDMAMADITSENCTNAGSNGTSVGSNCSEMEIKPAGQFPWQEEFSKQSRAAIGSKSMEDLNNLLTSYIEHVTPHYRDYYKLPNKAAKLKRNINENMIFFHMLHMDIRESLDNSHYVKKAESIYSYYEKMVDLIAMYLDLEITALSRKKETEKIVSNRLSSTLYTFLGHSEDYILDALLKSNLLSVVDSQKVSEPLLRKMLTELDVRQPLSKFTYVRFLLSFKLWKKVVCDEERRQDINKVALFRLDPPPDFFQVHMNTQILPLASKNTENPTDFHLKAKINLKKSREAFFRYCKENRPNSNPRNIPVIHKNDYSSCRQNSKDEEDSSICMLPDFMYLGIQEVCSLDGETGDVSDSFLSLESRQVKEEDDLSHQHSVSGDCCLSSINANATNGECLNGNWLGSDIALVDSSKVKQEDSKEHTEKNVVEGKDNQAPANIAIVSSTETEHQIQSYGALSVPHFDESPNESELSDALKILAEEAVRMREANFAEEKSKLEQVAYSNLPLKKRKAISHVGEAQSPPKSEKELSYPSSPMMSIAQLQSSQNTANKSVIVMNSQYNWRENTITPALTSKENTTVVSVSANYCNSKPLDMSANKNKTASLDGKGKHVQSVYSHHNNCNNNEFYLKYGYCESCQRPGCDKKCQEKFARCQFCHMASCKGGCKVQAFPPVYNVQQSVPCTVCKRSNCLGKCASGKQLPYCNNQVSRLCKCKNAKCTGQCKSRHTASRSTGKSLTTTTFSERKCSRCKMQGCDGHCKVILPSLQVNLMARKTTPHESHQKAVLNCFQCKTVGCNGRCMTSHTQCSNTLSSRKPSVASRTAADPSYGVAYKASCVYCFSSTCGGKCRLTSRSTNNSLATASDFSLMQSHIFVDKQMKCGRCRSALCSGKCQKGPAPSSSPFSGTVHGGSSSSSSGREKQQQQQSRTFTEVCLETTGSSKRTKSSNRQTRNSGSQKRTQPNNHYIADDVKRRKKSVPR